MRNQKRMARLETNSKIALFYCMSFYMYVSIHLLVSVTCERYNIEHMSTFIVQLETAICEMCMPAEMECSDKHDDNICIYILVYNIYILIWCSKNTVKT